MNLTPAQRNKALEEAKKLSTPSSNFATPLKKSPSVSSDSSITAYETPSSSDSQSSASSTSKSKRVHQKTRINRLTRFLCDEYLNAKVVFEFVYNKSGRVIDYRLDQVLEKIKPDLSTSQKKTLMTHNEQIKKDLKKKLASHKRYRKEQAKVGKVADDAHLSNVLIDLTVDSPSSSSTSSNLATPKEETVEQKPEPQELNKKEQATPKEETAKEETAEQEPEPQELNKKEQAKQFADKMKSLHGRKSCWRNRRKKQISKKQQMVEKSNNNKKGSTTRSNKDVENEKGSTTSSNTRSKTGSKRKSPKTTPARKSKRKKKVFKYALGQKVARDFGGKVFAGKISKLYDDDHTMCQVTYTDGDKEDLDTDEVTYGISLYIRDFGGEAALIE